MLGIVAGVNQKDRYVARCPHAVVVMPVVCNDFPQLQHFGAVVDILVVTQRPNFMVPTVQQTREIPPVALGQGGRCPCRAGRASFTGAGCDDDSRDSAVASR